MLHGYTDGGEIWCHFGVEESMTVKALSHKMTVLMSQSQNIIAKSLCLKIFLSHKIMS